MATGRWPLSAETLTSACEPRMSQMCQLRALKVPDYPDTFRSRMDRGGTRQLLAEAARRAACYLEALSNRPAGPLPGAAKKLVKALDQPLPDRGSDGADILAFLDDFGSAEFSTFPSYGSRPLRCGCRFSPRILSRSTPRPRSGLPRRRHATRSTAFQDSRSPDDRAQNRYPMPILGEGRDECFVGRIRDDLSCPNAINFWVVGDQLRKGAALNGIQIAEALIQTDPLPA